MAVIVNEVEGRYSTVYSNDFKADPDIVVSAPYQARFLTNWAGVDDESLYNVFDLRDGSGNLLNSTIEFVAPEPAGELATEEEQAEIDKVNSYSNFEGNKYGKAVGVVTVRVTPNASLAETYPYALVTIDGKEYDLKKLDNDFVFDMQRDHFIDIHWAGDVVESFRIVGKR